MRNKSDDVEVRRLLPAPAPGLKRAGKASPVFLSFFVFQARALMFLQASCQIQLSAAYSCAVKAGKEKGDTGHCNEHLRDVSH